MFKIHIYRKSKKSFFFKPYNFFLIFRSLTSRDCSPVSLIHVIFILSNSDQVSSLKEMKPQKLLVRTAKK